MARTERVENKTYDHGSTIVRIAGVLYDGIRTYTFAQKRNRGVVRGQGRSRAPKAKTKGMVDMGELSINVDRQDAERIREDLAQRGGSDSYGDPEFTVTIQVSEPGLPTRIDEFIGCTYDDESGGSDENSVDPLVEDIKFSYREAKRNGKKLGSGGR
jgi:hypothetical protein